MSLKVVDLFAGAGGMSCGFVQAGFHVELAVEQDLWATDTFRANHENCTLIVDDIRNVADEHFSGIRGVDVVIGGPPCQGFSISASNRRKSDDPRNFLYLEFIRAVSLICPKFVVMENVREISRFRLSDGSLLCEDIQKRLFELGYFSKLITLNANDFGVPQNRIRTFIIGAVDPDKLDQLMLKVQSIKYEEPARIKALTLWDAIEDLPVVIPWETTENSILKYRTSTNNIYQKSLRGNSRFIKNHVPMRHTPRMIERFQHLIQECEEGRKNLPTELSPRVRGNPEEISLKKYHQNHRRLDPNKPSPTITASFYSSFIHPYQPRNLTVREAARLQSFPDSYIFLGKRTTLSKKLLARKGEVGDLYLDQFNQVGNSVPPLLAKHIAEQIRKVIDL
jgi:DNA (cytosine-5)-methyltransferase 1